jgi:hypothetical protein
VLVTILDGKVPIFRVRYSLGKSCMTSFWIGWIFHSFPVYRRFLLSLRDGRAQGAEDSGDTTQLRDLVRAAYLLYGICNFLFSIRRSPSPISSTALL